MAADLRFRAMGSDAHLIVVGGPDRLADIAAARVHQLEARWSRFRPDSEVSRLNRHAGQAVAVSSDTVTLVRRAVEAWRMSAGAFDPTLLGDLVRAGYDRSFELLDGASAPGDSRLGPGVEGITIADDGCVRLPLGTGFDPGGIGKGLAADLICDEVLAAGAAGVCVNVGGDLRVAGTAPGGGPWTVAVEHPEAAEPVALVGLAAGAVATSTTLLRSWTTAGERRHHVIDPHTGLPSTTTLTQAAVVASEAWVAEALAKAVLLAGAEHPFDVLGGTGMEAMAVDRYGTVQSTPGFAAFLGSAILPGRVQGVAVGA